MKSAWTQQVVLRTSDQDNTVLQALKRVDKLAGPAVLHYVDVNTTFEACIMLCRRTCRTGPEVWLRLLK